MFPFRPKLLEPLNISIFGPHVKLQRTSNESLIKQTKNSMCDRWELPQGRMLVWKPEDLFSQRASVLAPEKEDVCFASEKETTQGQKHKGTLDQVPGFEPVLLSFLCLSALLLLYSVLNLRKKWRIQWYCKNISNPRRQKDRAVLASKIILASQKLLLPLKLVSRSS